MNQSIHNCGANIQLKTREMHFYRVKLLTVLLAMSHVVKARIFDSFVSYRYGTNMETLLDYERYEYEEVPQAPSSVDTALAYTI